MSETLLAALLGGVIGAIAGMGGSAVGALASLRASQLAARIPLAAKIHELARTIVELNAATGRPDYDEKLKIFQVAWNDLIVHQKILAPSKRLHILLELVRDAAIDPTLGQLGFPVLAGDALIVATYIVGAYSRHLFRWRAWFTERKIAKAFREAVSLRLSSSPTLLASCRRL